MAIQLKRQRHTGRSGAHLRVSVLLLGACAVVAWVLRRYDGGSWLGRGAPLLPVVLVSFNPARFASHTGNVLAQQARLAATRGVEVFTVELAYEDAPFAVTRSGDAHHLQLRWPHGVGPLWSKENLINIAVQRLLPPDWRAFAFVDAEVTFEDPLWAVRSLSAVTSGGVDALQPFEEVRYGGTHKLSLAAHLVMHGDYGLPYAPTSTTGMAWVLARRAYDALGGCYERSVVGGADRILAGALLANSSVVAVGWGGQDGAAGSSPVAAALTAYIDGARRAARGAAGGPLRVSFVPGRAWHAEHGRIVNRQYATRQSTCLRDFDPALHIAPDVDGLLLPTSAMPTATLECLRAYFAARLEDESASELPTAAAVGGESKAPLGSIYRRR